MQRIEGVIAIVTAITGIATATATWMANYYVREKRERESKIKLIALKREIDDFKIWYDIAISELFNMCDHATDKLSSGSVLSLYKSKVPLYKGDFKIWTEERDNIFYLLKKEESEDCAVSCKKVIEKAEEFVKMEQFLNAQLEINSDKDFADTCNEMMKKMPLDIKNDWGETFSECIRNGSKELNGLEKVLDVLAELTNN